MAIGARRIVQKSPMPRNKMRMGENKSTTPPRLNATSGDSCAH